MHTHCAVKVERSLPLTEQKSIHWFNEHTNKNLCVCWLHLGRASRDWAGGFCLPVGSGVPVCRPPPLHHFSSSIYIIARWTFLKVSLFSFFHRRRSRSREKTKGVVCGRSGYVWFTLLGKIRAGYLFALAPTLFVEVAPINAATFSFLIFLKFHLTVCVCYGGGEGIWICRRFFSNFVELFSVDISHWD